MDSGLSGQRVLITGASGAVGSATARAFDAEGASLVLHAHRHGDVTREMAQELDSALALDADLTDEVSVAQLFENAVRAQGGVDVVVANAGIFSTDSRPIDTMSLAQWSTTLSVNLTATFLVCREFFRLLRAASPAAPSLVLVSSTAALFGEEGHVDYAVSKAGLSGLLLSLKNEMVRLAPRGRVNAVCPGWIRSPMAAPALEIPGALEEATATMSLRKIAEPEDVALAIVFLSSARLAGHLSGVQLPIAGGMEGRLLHGTPEGPRTTDT